MNPSEGTEFAGPRRDFFEHESAKKWTALVFGILAATASAGAVVTQHPAFLGSAALLAAAAGTLFIFRHQSTLLWGLIATAPLTDYLGVTVGGITVRPYGPLTLLGIVLIIWQFLSHRRSTQRDTIAYYKGTLLILALLFTSKILTVYSLHTMPPGMTKAFVLKFVMFMGLQVSAGFVCASFIGSLGQLEKVLRGWVHVANVICFIALMQIVISNTTPYNFVWDRAASPLGRPYSVYREPDVLGCFYAAFLSLIFPLLVGNVKFINRTYLWLTFFVHTFFYLLIFVRAAWVAGAVCLGLYILLTAAAGRFKAVAPYLNGLFAALIFGLMGMAMAAPKAIEKLSERLASFANPTTESAGAYRLMELEAQSRLAFNPSPVTGGQLPVALGYGDFSWTYWAPVLCPPDQFNKLPEGYVNDGFCMALSVFFNNGLIGASLYLALFLALCFNFFNVLRRTRDPARQGILCGTFLSFMAVIVCFQFSNDPLYLTMWITLGFHLAAVFHVDRANAGELNTGIIDAATNSH